MKTTKYHIINKCAALWMTTLGAMAFLPSCSDHEATTAPQGEAITVSAIVPGQVWAEASRAAHTVKDLKLHYTDRDDQKQTFIVTDFTEQGGKITFYTEGNEENEKLMWGHVNADKPIHLTCVKNADGITLHTSVNKATADQPLAFTTALKPTMAKLTVNVTVNFDGKTPVHTDITDLQIAAKGAAGSYDPQTHSGVWPAGGSSSKKLSPSAGSNGVTATASTTLPQQKLGNLTLTYNNSTAENTADDITWTIDLSQVKVNGVSQAANQLVAGQQLILDITVSAMTVGTLADIDLQAFVLSTGTQEAPGITGVGYTLTTDATGIDTYTVQNVYGIQAWLKAYAAAEAGKKPKLVVDFKTETTEITLPDTMMEDVTASEDSKLVWQGKIWKAIHLKKNDGTTVTLSVVDGQVTDPSTNNNSEQS